MELKKGVAAGAAKAVAAWSNPGARGSSSSTTGAASRKSSSTGTSPRDIGSVVLKGGQLERLLGDLGGFLAQEDRYVELSQPWHRGVLTYGDLPAKYCDSTVLEPSALEALDASIDAVCAAAG